MMRLVRFFLERPRATTALLLGAMVFMLFFQLGARGLNEPDEGRYAEMGREMLVTGDRMVPRLNGVPHYAKPPWIYWCIAAGLRVAGINEWGARLPSALAASVTVFLVFALGKQMAGVRAGLCSAAALSTMLLFFAAGRLITPDMMLTAFVTLALGCFWRWRQTVRSAGASLEAGRLWLLGFYLALGGAFLDKGPVGPAIVGLALLGFLAATRDLRRLKEMRLLRGLILLALLALPWFFLMVWLNRDLLDFYLRGEIQDRVMSGRGRAKAWYYFFLVLPIACWPWTFLAIPALRRHWSRWRVEGGATGEVSAFLLSWVALPLGMFTLSGSKLPTYILPLMPPIALMIGLWLAGDQGEAAPEIPARGVRIATWIFLPALALAPWFVAHRVFSPPSPFWLAPFVAAAILTATGAVAVSRLAAPRRALARPVVWWLCAAVLLQGLIFLAARLESFLGHNSSWRSLIAAVPRERVVGVPISADLHPHAGSPVFSPRQGDLVAMYEFSFNSGSFTLMGARAEVVPRYGVDTLWEIARDRDAAPRPGRAELIALLRGPRRVWLFTRAEYVEGLRRETGVPIAVIATAGTKKHGGVLMRTR
ncbi:MAG: glycosyltransferase family 39 protein [Verrucomicrobiae bacterium]|nr:glycosyltransferase family 39 protein [Verrucomicrobiae bacterium]